MFDLYSINEDKSLWVITYQRNENSRIDTVFEGSWELAITKWNSILNDFA